MDSSGFTLQRGYLWNGKTQIRYLGRESFVHDPYGRCIFWTELPKRPKAYFKLMGRNE